MNIGIVTPGFSANEEDWSIPVHQHLIRELSQYENVRVIALRYPHTKKPYSVYKARVYPIGAGSWAQGIERLKLWRDARQLIQVLHREQPFDVLHALWADETGFIASLTGKQLRIPVVVSIAGGELVGLPDIHYGSQLRRFSRWTVKRALNWATAITVACSYAKHLLCRAIPDISNNRIYRITPGVEPSMFRPAPENLRKPRHLVHVASLVPVKDQMTLLKAIAQLDDVTLDIVGEGYLQSELEKLAKESGIHKKICFRGKASHPQLSRYYQQASLHILTSRHEALGMVTLEAAACGVPGISTDVGFLPDCPDMGWIVPVGDSERLARTIDGALNDHEHYLEISRSAYQAIQGHYTIQHTTTQLRELYSRLQA